MIQQVCTIYRKNWGWPCHINNVSPVGQKTAWRICKYLAFVVAVLLSFARFYLLPLSRAQPIRFALNNNNTPMVSKQSQFLITRDRITHYTRVIRKCCDAPGVALFIMFNIWQSSPQAGRKRKRRKKCFCLLCPDWFSLDPAVGCSVRHSALVNWKLWH